ncbi:MAG: sensor histidine kinase [Acidimicrobiia bacterium]
MLSRIPIRWKLALLVGGCGLAVLAALVPLESQRARGSAEQALDDALREELGEAVGIVANGQSPTVLGDAHATSATRFVYLLLDQDGQVEAASEEHLTTTLVRDGGAPLAGPSDIIDVTESGSGTRMRALSVALTIDGAPKILVVAADTSGVRSAGADGARRTITVGALASMFIALGTYLITGVALRPVERIRISALRVARGDPDAHIEIPVADDELRRLAVAFDETVSELERSAAARDRFIAEASHELRTPITRLRTGLDLALRRPRTVDELSSALAEASRHTSQLTRLVEQLLDLSRLQAGRELDSCSVAVDEVIAEVVECFPDVEWETSGLWTRGDRDMLQRAVQNLVDNAFVHGRPPVRVTSSPRADELVIEVSDAGNGVDGEDGILTHEPFRRSNAARGRVGTGLGLAIVAEIVQQHHGHVELAHRDGRTAACIHLPAADAARSDQ